MGWCRKKHREDESSVFIVVQVNKMTGEDKRDLVAFYSKIHFHLWMKVKENPKCSSGTLSCTGKILVYLILCTLSTRPSFWLGI